MSDSALQAARAAVTAFEAIPLGEPFADARSAAMGAIATLRNDAMPAISRYEPFGADAIADFNFLIESGIKKQEFAGALLAIFPIALEQHPKLARLLLSPAVLIRIRDIAPMDGELECISYLQRCAEHLVGRPEFEPAATWLVESMTLAERCAAHEERHEAYIRAEQERIEAEERQARQAIEAADHARRAELVGFFTGRASQRFVLNGSNRVVSGWNVGLAVRDRSTFYDDNGEQMAPPDLEFLELLRRRTLAAEAVTVS